MNFLAGQILAFDKPLGMTSFGLVAKVRWLLTRRMDGRRIKVGHAGTLDPLATGVLLICTGRATKQIPQLQLGVKAYEATLRLGATHQVLTLSTTSTPLIPPNTSREKWWSKR